MFVGVFVTIYLSFQLDNPQCPIHGKNVTAAMLMYSTYLYLFAEFFVNSYGVGCFLYLYKAQIASCSRSELIKKKETPLLPRFSNVHHQPKRK